MKRPKNWEQKTLDIKSLNTNGTPLKEAVKLYDWTIPMYRNYHKELNLPRTIGRRYKTNIHYFENIDNEYKAYFLGLIYADGCIYSPNSGKSSKVLSIKLQEQDGYILYKLAELISPERKPRIITEYNQFTEENVNRVMYSINSSKMYNDLYKLGIRERKSNSNLLFPNLDKDLYRHFVRGFLDGDGYISYRKGRNTACVGFVSTDNNFLLDIAALFAFKFCNGIKNNRKLPVYYLTTESRKNVLYLKDYLYKDSNIFLSRKFEKINMVTAS